MPPTSLEPPVLLQRAVSEQLQIFGEQAFDLTGEIRDTYREPLTRYRDRLLSYFFGNFYGSIRAPRPRRDGTYDPNQGPEQIWDLLRARELKAEATLAGEFSDVLRDTEASMQDVLDEHLVEGYEESYDLGLWMLYLGGIDSTIAKAPPDRSAIKVALIAAGIGGLGYPTRLRAWRADTESRYQRRLRGLIASGATGQETMDAFDSLATTFVGRIEGLGQNELFRAYTVGAETATAAFTDKLEGEVWITRGDTLVCPICAEKNLTITTQQPIRDSHPGCRCRKAPIPLNYAGQPIDYASFLQKLGRR